MHYAPSALPHLTLPHPSTCTEGRTARAVTAGAGGVERTGKWKGGRTVSGGILCMTTGRSVQVLSVYPFTVVAQESKGRQRARRTSAAKPAAVTSPVPVIASSTASRTVARVSPGDVLLLGLRRPIDFVCPSRTQSKACTCLLCCTSPVQQLCAHSFVTLQQIKRAHNQHCELHGQPD